MHAYTCTHSCIQTQSQRERHASMHACMHACIEHSIRKLLGFFSTHECKACIRFLQTKLLRISSAQRRVCRIGAHFLCSENILHVGSIESQMLESGLLIASAARKKYGFSNRVQGSGFRARYIPSSRCRIDSCSCVSIPSTRRKQSMDSDKTDVKHRDLTKSQDR
jgi:hypothetical protein